MAQAGFSARRDDRFPGCHLHRQGLRPKPASHRHLGASDASNARCSRAESRWHVLHEGLIIDQPNQRSIRVEHLDLVRKTGVRHEVGEGRWVDSTKIILPSGEGSIELIIPETPRS